MRKIILMVLINVFIQCQTQKLNNSMMPTIDKKFEKIETENRLRKVIENNRIITFISAKIGFSESIYSMDSYFNIVKNYYPSKNIQNKGVEFNEGSQVGIWYYFDESGKLVKEENTDEGYGFTPEKVLGYCEKNKIELPKGYHESGFYTQVRKEILNSKKVWVIKYLIPGGDIQRVVLDGQTGKELEKKVVPFVSS